MAIIQRLKTKVTELEKIFEGVYLVSFDASARQTKFSPGQFTHLALDEFDPSLGFWPESRVFSIASEPKSDKITIVYSVKGAYTKRMENELSIGKTVWLKYPYGDFSVHTMSEAEDPLVFVSGGTGISPFIPFLKECFTAKSNRTIHHHHGLRKNGMLIFKDELEEASSLKGFKGFLSIEDEYPQPVLTNWNIKYGRLNLLDIIVSTKELGEKTKIFLSGPPMMINYFKSGLLKIGIKDTQIKIDSWE